MDNVVTGIEEVPTTETEDTEDEPKNLLNEPQSHVESAVENLQLLRRLFFSIVEHLQETAQRQAQLNDETQSLATEVDEATRERDLGQKKMRQEELQEIANEIQQALKEQATLPEASQDQSIPEEQQKAAESLRKAAGLVEEATAEMESATTKMSESPELVPIREHQDAALLKLLEALAALQPPQDQDDSQGEDQQEQQDQQQSESDQQDQPQDSKSGINQLLQMVRDREAQRREENDKKAKAGRAPTLRDW